MNAENCQLAKAFVSTSYIEQGSQALNRRQRLIKALLSQRRLPPDGWDDATIQLFLQVSMCSACSDSMNFECIASDCARHRVTLHAQPVEILGKKDYAAHLYKPTLRPAREAYGAFKLCPAAGKGTTRVSLLTKAVRVDRR